MRDINDVLTSSEEVARSLQEYWHELCKELESAYDEIGTMEPDLKDVEARIKRALEILGW